MGEAACAEDDCAHDRKYMILAHVRTICWGESEGQRCARFFMSFLVELLRLKRRMADEGTQQFW